MGNVYLRVPCRRILAVQAGGGPSFDPVSDEALWEGPDYPETQAAHVEAKANEELLRRINKRAGEERCSGRRAPHHAAHAALAPTVQSLLLVSGVEPAAQLGEGVSVSTVAAEAVQNVRSLLTSFLPGKRVRVASLQNLS